MTETTLKAGTLLASFTGLEATDSNGKLPKHIYRQGNKYAVVFTRRARRKPKIVVGVYSELEHAIRARNEFLGK